MDRDKLLELLQRLLQESMSDGFNYDFAAVDINQRGIYVTTKQHEMFLVRVEEQ
jgi:hypothetical protein